MIKLFYYTGNFGDSLSYYIVKKISSDDVKFSQPFSAIEFFRNFFACIKHITSWPFSVIKKNLTFTRGKLLFAIGSLIENSKSNCICWGTGMAQPNKIPSGGRFIMTRGPLSRNVLEEHGFKVESKISGDPALLLPLILNPSFKKNYRVGLICHNVDIDAIGKMRIPDDVNIISLKTDDVEGVVNEIVSCKFIYTTSLHGLIVSHVYGIPTIWVERKQLPGGRFKFLDYLKSVGIEEYCPLQISDVVNSNFTLGQSEYQKYPVVKMVKNAQMELLSRAPFTLKKDLKWKNQSCQ